MGFYSRYILRFFTFISLLLFFSNCSNIPISEKSIKIEICTTVSSKQNNIYSVSNLKFEPTKTYRRTLDSIVWCKIKLNNTELRKELFLIGSDAHFHYGKAYVVSKDSKILSLANFSNTGTNFFENIFYKYPAWKLPIDLKSSDTIFIEIIGHKLRNRLDFFIEDYNQFFKRMQLEYFWTGSFVFFLFVLILIVFSYSILLNEYALIFYVFFIVFVIIDFLSFKGVGKQYLWGNNNYLLHNRTYTFCIAFSLLSIFFDLFYNSNKKSRWIYFSFRFILPTIGLSVFLLSLFTYFLHWNININYWSFHFLKYCTIFFFFGHLYLVYKKQIPLYLAIGFSLHLILLYTYQASIPTIELGSKPIQRFLFLNMSYLSYSIEILFVVYYIFTRFNTVKKRYKRLKRRNAHLLFSMNNQYLEAQLKERSELLDKIHNSFGGSIEALKYHLTKEVSLENIQESVDNFYHNYRSLIATLNAPELNNFNLTHKIEEYLDNNFGEFPIKILSQIDLQNQFLSKKITYFTYYTIIELVTNVIKHAFAEKLEVKTEIVENMLTIEVIDNGIGFYKIQNKAFGLTSIRDKANELNGHFEILKPPKGSHLKIQIPIS